MARRPKFGPVLPARISKTTNPMKTHPELNSRSEPHSPPGVRLVLKLALAAQLSTLAVQAGPHKFGSPNPLEPNAGQWRTWVIPSGADFRAPPPPGVSQTRAELKSLATLISQRNETDLEQIQFWDAGAPAYRWLDLLNNRTLAGENIPFRAYTYLTIAMYDATIATWESKYAYDRGRPSELDQKIPTAVNVPNSPSYPSEHSATAQAAATILAHFFPSQAAEFDAMAQQAGWSRVLAGVQYPSDHHAGIELGRRVGEQVIAFAQEDGANIPWTGVTPLGPCKWLQTGPPPGNAAVATMRPLLLASPDQFRSPPPPECDSPELLAEAAAVRNFPRTFVSNYKAYYWQSPDGLMVWPYRLSDKWIAEDRLDNNPPRVARIYALIAGSFYDAFIASNDGKFAYWLIRPHQYDSGIVPLFPVPNFPSYPSNHSTLSTARAEIVAHLFPGRADQIRALGQEAGDSRIWAGIHFPVDNVAGVNLGRSVADLFIQWAETDGSE